MLNEKRMLQKEQYHYIGIHTFDGQKKKVPDQRGYGSLRGKEERATTAPEPATLSTAKKQRVNRKTLWQVLRW